MLRKVLWVAAACAAVLAALAVSRGLNFDEPPRQPAEAAGPVEIVTPPPEPAPESSAEPEALPPTPEDLQIQEDAAATGMTTVEPPPVEPAAPPSESPPF